MVVGLVIGEGTILLLTEGGVVEMIMGMVVDPEIREVETLEVPLDLQVVGQMMKMMKIKDEEEDQEKGNVKIVVVTTIPQGTQTVHEDKNSVSSVSPSTTTMTTVTIAGTHLRANFVEAIPTTHHKTVLVGNRTNSERRRMIFDAQVRKVK